MSALFRPKRFFVKIKSRETFRIELTLRDRSRALANINGWIFDAWAKLSDDSEVQGTVDVDTTTSTIVVLFPVMSVIGDSIVNVLADFGLANVQICIVDVSLTIEEAA